MKEIKSHTEMLKAINGKEKSFVLLYKKGSSSSDCAEQNFTMAAEKNTKAELLKANVAEIRDIHGNYEIKTVPTVLTFENGRFSNVVKGCMDVDYYASLFNGELFSAPQQNGEGKPRQKSVTVYSTPTCVWCNRIKDHFNRNGIVYTDIDVSADTAKAEEMKRKSGQMGVPQTEIDGQMIVGFDKARINKLLGI